MKHQADWSGPNGDVWAANWQRIDRALAGVSAKLDPLILGASPAGQFRAFDIGCGTGSTALALAGTRPDAEIVACDLSQAQIDIARRRGAQAPDLRFITGDARTVMAAQGRFDLVFSRHGVMFFDQPIDAFRIIRNSVNPGGKLVFSCFQAWESNPWASQVAAVVQGAPVAVPGRSPGGFAFADPDYVSDILTCAGWSELDIQPLAFDYVAGQGINSVEDAMDLLGRIGPAARVLEDLPESDRDGGRQRMMDVLADRQEGDRIVFPANAWLCVAVAP